MSGFDRGRARGQRWRVQAHLVTQWLSSSSAPRRGDACLRASRCLGVWGLALWLGMASACTPRKENECAKVQSRVLEEIRVVDSFHDHFHDPEAIARHARRLRGITAELRALDLRDARLRVAVEGYGTSIDRLAGAWDELAASQGAGGADAGPAASFPALMPVPLQELLSAHAAVMNGARSAISNACGTR